MWTVWTKPKMLLRKNRLILDGKANLPKNDNANYLWIQYFYNYLKPTGRAGFVMASSASDADTAKKTYGKAGKTGAVDVMMAIGNNFSIPVHCPHTLVLTGQKKDKEKR